MDSLIRNKIVLTSLYVSIFILVFSPMYIQVSLLEDKGSPSFLFIIALIPSFLLLWVKWLKELPSPLDVSAHPKKLLFILCSLGTICTLLCVVYLPYLSYKEDRSGELAGLFWALFFFIGPVVSPLIIGKVLEIKLTIYKYIFMLFLINPLIIYSAMLLRFFNSSA